MIKYTDRQKLDAVEAYRKGRGGLIATAAAQGVNVASLRKWVYEGGETIDEINGPD